MLACRTLMARKTKIHHNNNTLIPSNHFLLRWRRYMKTQIEKWDCLPSDWNKPVALWSSSIRDCFKLTRWFFMGCHPRMAFCSIICRQDSFWDAMTPGKDRSDGSFRRRMTSTMPTSSSTNEGIPAKEFTSQTDLAVQIIVKVEHITLWKSKSLHRLIVRETHETTNKEQSSPNSIHANTEKVSNTFHRGNHWCIHACHFSKSVVLTYSLLLGGNVHCMVSSNLAIATVNSGKWIITGQRTSNQPSKYATDRTNCTQKLPFFRLQIMCDPPAHDP